MANNVLGSGLVALAFSLSQCTLVPGIALLVVTGAIACYSQSMIVNSCAVVGKYAYKEMGAEIFGKTGGTLISLVMLCYTLGSVTSYSVIIADLFTLVFKLLTPDIALLSSRVFISCIVALVFLLPLCLLKTMDSLRFFSFVSVVSILVTVCVVLVEFTTHGTDPSVEVFRLSGAILQVIPVMCVSFNCHYNVPRYYQELKARSKSRMWMVSIGASCLVLAAYLIVSVSGYLEFGTKTEGNILNNYGVNSASATVARIGLGVGIILHFPITYFAVRNNLHQLFCFKQEFHHFGLRFGTAAGVLVSTVYLALKVTKISTVLAFNGSLFGTWMMFIIPGLMYIKCGPKDRKRWTRVGAWLLAIFGVFVFVTGTTFNILNLLRPHEPTAEPTLEPTAGVDVESLLAWGRELLGLIA